MLNVDFLLGERNYIRNELAIFCLFGSDLDVKHHFYLLDHIEEIDGFQLNLITEIGRGSYLVVNP